MAGHECVQGRRLELLEEDIRKQREVTNGKFDDLRDDMNSGFSKLWGKIDGLSGSTLANKMDIKWILLTIGFFAMIVKDVVIGLLKG